MAEKKATELKGEVNLIRTSMLDGSFLKFSYVLCNITGLFKMETDQLRPLGSVLKLGIWSIPIFYYIDYVHFQLFSNCYAHALKRIWMYMPGPWV